MQTFPSNIYSDPSYLGNRVTDVTPSTLARLRMQRTALIKNRNETVTLLCNSLDAQGNPTAVCKTVKDVVNEKEQPTPSECNAASCAQTGTKWCAQCHAVKYCSRECQVLDWKVSSYCAVRTCQFFRHAHLLYAVRFRRPSRGVQQC
jgi:MYND finger